MIIVNIINDKLPFKGSNFILIYIPLIWVGITFPLLTGVAKVFNSKEEINKKLALFTIVLGILMIIVTFLGPLILYYLQLQNLKEIERLKQVIQQHQ